MRGSRRHGRPQAHHPRCGDRRHRTQGRARLAGRGGRRAGWGGRVAALLPLRQPQRTHPGHARTRQRARRARPSSTSTPAGAAVPSSSYRCLFAQLEDPVQARELSILWSEVMAAAFFDASLRDQLAQASRRWNTLLADAVWQWPGGWVDRSARRAQRRRGAAHRVGRRDQRSLACGLITRERARELLAMSVASLLGSTMRW